VGIEFGRKHSVDVVIAALNEEAGIGITMAEISRNMNNCQILVVDGHSHDRTVEIAKDAGANVLFQDGIGKGDAVAKGFGCKDLDSNFIALTDADFTYPAEYIPKMISILESNPWVGMVCGNRLNGYVEENALHNLFYFGNRLLAFSHSLLNGVNLEDPLTGLRVIRAEILKGWHVKSKGFDIEVELNSGVGRRGFGIVEIPISYRKRLGEKKLKVRDGGAIFKRIMLESTSLSWLGQHQNAPVSALSF
jgi:glycosyltransferase involved in cell wall biosynthesis